MIAIVDVCSGNLRSVEKALLAVGGQVTITQDPEIIRAADKVVVPGQGAFDTFMRGLTARGLESALRDVIARGVPYLGICLGLQILFDQSEEHGPVRGLGLVPGTVVRFRPTDHACKVPHMGWNRIERPPGAPNDPLWPAVPAETYVYFVHSYRVVPDDPRMVVLTSDHGGSFCAAIRHRNLFACQFHPEKSQQVGLAFLNRFVAA
jgi:glutamine amidotransferase